ncbi:zeta toxin family protein [Flavobacterium hercynium]|uniref:Zeta toxin n=1 Tax=Flavobacterium hercynium TaxID=387094 RepID=A0A226HEL8_9FLAO|nr:zeta toxin family protein [Flavobacterium hercynium]OXA92106.1 zeta toxin [Flavobacterium hercynium]SMP24957.1 Predicted ABC-type ATPase [Flavobacterium hercynium]
MKDKNLYIISGCNGAGKTTASYTILPEILDCKEFVNADEIAKGLSPFQPEKVSFEAGRIMLNRIDELLQKEVDFAFETTLSAKSYASIVKKAQDQGYFVTLIFFWLNSVELAKQRVKIRVNEGGHNIPEDVIERRYIRGIKNFFKIYLNKCNNVMLFDNSNKLPVLILEKELNDKIQIIDSDLFNIINNLKDDKR